MCVRRRRSPGEHTGSTRIGQCRGGGGAGWRFAANAPPGDRRLVSGGVDRKGDPGPTARFSPALLPSCSRHRRSCAWPEAEVVQVRVVAARESMYTFPRGSASRAGSVSRCDKSRCAVRPNRRCARRRRLGSRRRSSTARRGASSSATTDALGGCSPSNIRPKRSRYGRLANVHPVIRPRWSAGARPCAVFACRLLQLDRNPMPEVLSDCPKYPRCSMTE